MIKEVCNYLRSMLAEKSDGRMGNVHEKPTNDMNCDYVQLWKQPFKMKLEG